MRNILVVKSSAGGENSASNQLVDLAVARLTAGATDVAVFERNLDREPIAALNSSTVAGIGRPGVDTPAAQAVRALSDRLIAELDEADVVVIGSPMYNFTIPAPLKTWFDHILRAGLTFNFTPTGPVGVLAPKPFLIVQTRGGLYSEGPNTAADAQEPLFRAMLRFIGMTDVQFVRAEGMVLRGRDVVIGEAESQIDAITSELRKTIVESVAG